MIKAIIFDCFGVLTGDKWKDFVWGLPKDQQEPARELNRALDRGFISQQEFAKSIYDVTGHQPKFVEQLINSEMTKNTKLIDVIKSLKQTYKIGLLSNVSTDWIETSFLSKSDLELFDDIVLSYRVGLIKPDPAIYPLVAGRLGLQTTDCLLVDDGPRNCTGAIEAGMQAIVYKEFDQFKHELEQLIKTSQSE